MRRHLSVVVGIAACVLAMAGCSTQAPIRLYSLQSPDAGMPVRDHLQPVWVTLPNVGVPVQVDQLEWLVRTPDGSLRLLEQTRWAAPLRSEVRAALLDGLQTRWGASDAQQGVPPKAAVWRVIVDVQRFESLPGVEARLDARWSIASTGADAKGAVATCRGQWAEGASGDIAALVEAHRANVRRLTDAIGEGLQAAARGAEVTCGAAAGLS